MLSGKKFSTRSIYFGFGFYENDFMVAGDWSWFSIDIASLPILASLFIGSMRRMRLGFHYSFERLKSTLEPPKKKDVKPGT